MFLTMIKPTEVCNYIQGNSFIWSPVNSVVSLHPLVAIIHLLCHTGMCFINSITVLTMDNSVGIPHD